MLRRALETQRAEHPHAIAADHYSAQVAALQAPQTPQTAAKYSTLAGALLAAQAEVMILKGELNRAHAQLQPPAGDPKHDRIAITLDGAPLVVDFTASPAEPENGLAEPEVDVCKVYLRGADVSELLSERFGQIAELVLAAVEHRAREAAL